MPPAIGQDAVRHEHLDAAGGAGRRKVAAMSGQVARRPMPVRRSTNRFPAVIVVDGPAIVRVHEAELP